MVVIHRRLGSRDGSFGGGLAETPGEMKLPGTRSPWIVNAFFGARLAKLKHQRWCKSEKLLTGGRFCAAVLPIKGL